MKRISSTIILAFIALLIFLLGFVSLWTFSLLKAETRGHTFQFALLQTEVVGKPLVDLINRAQVYLTSPEKLSEGSTVEQKALGIELRVPLKPEGDHWKIDTASSDEDLLKFIGTLKGTGVALHPLSDERHLIALTRLSKTSGVLAILNITKVFRECEGQPIGAINPDGGVLLACDGTVKDMVKATDPKSLSRIKDSKFSAGSFETDDKNNLLYSYYQPSTLLSIIGVTPAKMAMRSAYFLVLRMVLLMLCALGIAVLISVFLSKKVTSPIEVLTEATERISRGEFDFPIEVKSRNEIRTLADSVRRMSQQIKKLIVSEIEKTKIEAQLEVAATIQKTLLPPVSVDVDGFKIESLYRPADQCGGDWWFYMNMGPKLILLIGDVTGHGYPSALLVAATRGGVALLEADLEKTNPNQFNASDILSTLNRVVFDSMQGKLNMTALCMVIDKATGDYTISSAAHQPSYLLKADTGEVNSLMLAGNRLGETRDLAVKCDEMSGVLNPGEKIVLSTDGLQDLGPEEKMIGRKGVNKFYKRYAAASSAEIIEKVESELIPLNEGIPLRDDITLVILERAMNA